MSIMYTIAYYYGLFSASFVGIVLFLYMLSSVFPVAGFVGRCLAAYVSLVICAIYGVIASIVLRVVGNPGIAQWATARSFKYVMWLTTGVTCEIDDPEDYLNKSRPAVFIGNHQTELDVLMLGHIFPQYCSVTAKKSLKSTPFLGWYMSLSGTVFIDRANSADARHAMAGAADELTKRRQSVYMFPEGTRSYAKEPMLLPFKKGAFHLAVQAGVPIVPVLVANYSDLLYVKGLRFNSGRILIKVLKPIETKNLKASDVEDLTRDTRELMLRELVTLTERQRGHKVAMSSHNPSGREGVVKASGAKATLS